MMTKNHLTTIQNKWTSSTRCQNIGWILLPQVAAFCPPSAPENFYDCLFYELNGVIFMKTFIKAFFFRDHPHWKFGDWLIGTDAALQLITSKTMLWPSNKHKNVTLSCEIFSGAGSLSSLTADSWFWTNSMSSFLFPAQNTATSISSSSSLWSFPTLAGTAISLKKCSGGIGSMIWQNFWSNWILCLELMATKRRQILLYNLHWLHLEFWCKWDPEDAFVHAGWVNMCLQWQMGVG